jgi:PAS domain S-box-containing protein
VNWLFETQGILSRYQGCGWPSSLIWLHNGSDAVIGVSYYLIPLIISFFLWRRRHDFPWWAITVMGLFVAFILLCGTTHILEVITTYIPIYWASGIVKLMTAGVSLMAMAALFYIVPKVLTLHTPQQLEREIAERTIQWHAQKSILEAITDNASTSIFMMDPNGVCTYMNPAAEKMVGYTADEFIGHRFHELVHHSHPDGSDYPSEDCVIVAAVRHQRRLLDHEDVFIHKDGTYFPVRCYATPILCDDVFTGTVFEIRDATKEKKIERDMQEASTRKDEFLAMLAHELRNPLVPIRSGLEILRMSNVTADVAIRAMEMMQKQVGHITRLVDDLLDASRITRGRIELRTQPVRLNDAISQAVESVRSLAVIRNHSLRTTAPNKSVLVAADPTRLEQILVNLLNNAVKYTPAGGNIEVSLSAEDEQAVVRVRDDGVGIAPELLPGIFELFTQGKRTLDRAEGGLGIGLMMVKKLAELHSGTVIVESEGPGKGAIFTVRLPRLPHRAEETAPMDDDLRILIVEDNHDGAQSLVLLLNAWGYRPQVAHDGPTALDIFHLREPHVVLCDIGLPGMIGYEVARRMRISGDKDLVLVALTGYGGEENKQRSLEAGFDIHMTKPPDARILERLLANRRDLLCKRRTNALE